MLPAPHPMTSVTLRAYYMHTMLEAKVKTDRLLAYPVAVNWRSWPMFVLHELIPEFRLGCHDVVNTFVERNFARLLPTLSMSGS